MSWIANLVAIGAGAVAGAALEKRASARIRGALDSGVSLEALTSPADDEFSGLLEVSSGAEIYWSARGAGSPTFLFVHGICLTSDVWYTQKRDLGASHRVVAIDMAGHGRSTITADHTQMQTFAADIADVVRELDLHDTILVGHSMGGMATQQFLLDYADLAFERLRGTVLLSTSPTGRLATAVFSGYRMQHLLADVEARRVAPMTIWGAGRFPLERLLGPTDNSALLVRGAFGSAPSESELEFTRRLVAATPQETLQASMAAIYGYDVRERLDEIGVPVLIVTGRRDMLTPLYTAYESARNIRDARIKVLGRRGHMIMFEEPDSLEQYLLDFADALAPKPGGIGGTGIAGMMAEDRRATRA